MKKKIIRVVTSDVSFGLLTGQLKYLSEHYEIIGVSSKGTKIDEIIKKEGIKIIPVEMERPISPFKDLKSLYNLYVLFKKEKPFIVHSITPKAGLLSMVASYFARVPNRIHTFTGLIFPTQEGLIKKVLIFTDKILCACATKIFPEGNGVKTDLENYKITSKPLNVLANGNINGIDLDYFSPHLFSDSFKTELKTSLKIENSDFVFVFMGRLVKDKGINELIAAFSKLCEHNNGLKLLLVGTYEHELDPLKPETLDIINHNKNIISTGWVNDVRPYFAIANVLTFPSYREGFPNVVIQAGAMGLPSIVTDISGSNEIIIEGQNGTIIPVKSEEHLYNKMMELYFNPKLFSSEKCRELIVSRYEQQMVWNALLDEYRKLS